MNKAAFLKELRKGLRQLPQAERQQYIDYYAEMIDDRMEEGVSEEEAVAALGSTDEIAAQILTDTPVKPARKFPVCAIVLIVLGSPIWLTLALGLLMVLLGVALVIAAMYAVLWIMIAVLYAGDLCLLTGLVVGIAAGCYYAASGLAAPALLLFGSALICGGSTVLLFFGCNKLAVWTAKLGKWAVLHIAALFSRKEKKA